MDFISRIASFFISNFPAASLIAWLFPLTIIWSFLAAYMAGTCKRHFNWNTGYSRKLFHFLIFFTACIYQLKFGLGGVFILGWSVTAVIIYSCYQGSGNLLYEGMAREKDAPYRTRYIVYSYLSTFAGGVLSNLFFGYYAIFGYAVTGIADALAEPVGTRFGRHTYPVFSFDKRKHSRRSLEGSMAVFLAAVFIAAAICYASPLSISIPLLIWGGAICAVSEAISPGGFDNAVLQLTASLVFCIFTR
jgi:phytol kinase